MKMKKRFLSILLSLVMVLGLMPGMSLTAYAEGEETLLTTITNVAYKNNTSDLNTTDGIAHVAFSSNSVKNDGDSWAMSLS
jgi:hypothetical protein